MKKQEPKELKNEEGFVKQKVMKDVDFKLGDKKSLLMEVHHLRGECDKMRYTPEELKPRSDAAVTSNPQNGDGDLALTDGMRAGSNEEESEDEDEAGYAGANG